MEQQKFGTSVKLFDSAVKLTALQLGAAPPALVRVWTMIVEPALNCACDPPPWPKTLNSATLQDWLRPNGLVWDAA